MACNIFVNLYNNLMDTHNSTSERIKNRRFRSLFGLSPELCTIIWNKTLPHHPNNTKHIHLLMALYFLKCYNTESINAALFKVDEKTFRKWQWIFIRFSNRYRGSSNFDNCFVSLDGTDFPIEEPQIFNPKWYSHKFKGPGIRYEIGLCIKTGDIAWAFGGVPCGEWPDLKLARDQYISRVDEGEKTIADDGYGDQEYFIYPRAYPNERRYLKLIMSRHETVNHRIRHFNILKQKFRHDLTLHPICFHAIINITQLAFENGERLFMIII